MEQNQENPPDGGNLESQKNLIDNVEIKQTLKTAINLARRYGYRIDDEAHSLAGFSVVIALRYWRKKRETKFSTYVVKIFLRAMSRFNRWRFFVPIDETFVNRKIQDDAGQRLLMQLPEPIRSVCFGIWVERKTLLEVQQQYCVTRTQVNHWLETVAEFVRHSLEDQP